MKLQFQKLSYHYGKQTVFQNLDGAFESGRIVALLGPSGCGKSTLLRLLAGFLKPQDGHLFISPEFLGKVAMVFQESELLPWRTALENVQLPSEIIHNPSSKEVLEKIFTELGLGGAQAKYPRQLSGGMKMRVSLARALVQKPNLLLMDEPFSALDETTREGLQVLTRKLTLENPSRLTVFVTHSISEALFIADEIHVMQSGGGWKMNFQNPAPRERGIEFLNSKDFFEIKREWTPRLREVFS